VDPLKTKKGVFRNTICERIRAHPEQKWLIFNDNTSALFEAQGILEGLGVKAVMLDGGNVAAVDRAITNYKTKDVQVLLLNSMLEGCGMNLENTTHLLFMHVTRPRLVEQVVGRAQRYGRKGALNIIGLFNNHENESMAIDDEEVYTKRYFVD
jgi:superfamily II DNA/RNA helicase